MKELQITVKNEVGLHARPAASFVTAALKFQSDITVVKDDKSANGKSLISILALGVGYGDIVSIKALGEDEDVAVETLKELIKNKLGEEK